MAASPRTTVMQPAVTANSFIAFTGISDVPMPMSDSIDLIGISPGVGFTVKTRSGRSARGIESFQYAVVSP